MFDKLTLIFPYYKNPIMLKEQIEHLKTFPQAIKDNLEVIVVDDGSPEYSLEDYIWPQDQFGLAKFSVYRIEVDVRWNWIAARNIAMYHADTTWALMTDIDHIIPADTLSEILESGFLKESCAYKFQRHEIVQGGGLREINPHANTWLISPSTFHALGAYDERFSGYYGTDGEFKRRVEGYCGPVAVLPWPVIRVNRNIVSDADTIDYERKTQADKVNVARIYKEIEKAPIQRKNRSFPYHRIL